MADTTLQRARHAFRDARHGLAHAVVAGRRGEIERAAREVLAARDRLAEAMERPDDRHRRDVRVLQRWRRFALSALRHDPPPAGLVDRARDLVALNDSRRTR